MVEQAAEALADTKAIGVMIILIVMGASFLYGDTPRPPTQPSDQVVIASLRSELDDSNHKLDIARKALDIQFRLTDAEFAMNEELLAMNKGEVTKVMTPHLDKILKIEQELVALAKENQ